MNKKYLQHIELDKIVDLAAMRAICEETKEELRQEMPMLSTSDVRDALAQTNSMASQLLKNGNPRISGAKGSRAAVNRAAKSGILSMGELIVIGRALHNFTVLHAWFTPEENSLDSINDLFFSITPQPALEKSIYEKILSQTEMADTASDELYSIRKKIRDAENSIRNKLDDFTKNAGTAKYLQESVVSIRNGRFVVPVKAEHRNDVGGVIHDVSSSGGTLFVEPTAVVETNAKILQLKNQEQSEIERILGELSQEVSEIAEFFDASYLAMIMIDKIVAKAELGLSMNGICPVVNDTQSFCLVKARHPLLAKDSVVPVNIELGDAFDTMIITGPNTGGKTVALKTAGLLCSMAQLGYLVPAHDTSTVCVFDQILVDIGDEQSIEQSLSTFSGHIKNITEILKVVDDKSLVLLDELGAGTDPGEGAALAIAIIEQFRRTGARIMATTHYAELKMFALDTPGVQNAGSEFNIETLRPTYRLIVGVPGRSNAFLISEKLGIPQFVIENARQHMSNEQRRFETVLAQLEDLKLEFSKQEEEIEQLRYESTHLVENAQKQRDELIQQGEDELSAAREKAKTLVDDVQNKAYDLAEEMKRLEKDKRTSNAQKAQRAKEIARKETETLMTTAKKGEVSTAKVFTPLQSVKVGQEVYWPEMDKLAYVLSLPDRAGLVEIRAGVLKSKIPLTSLSKPPKKQAAKSQRSRQPATGNKRVTSMQPRTPQAEINLLGKTVDEALLETDQFLDNAMMTGLSTVYIIHGRGTGALRSAIQAHLHGNKHIKEYRLGRYGEGEDGVTVVELE